MGWGLSKIRERQRNRTTVAGGAVASYWLVSQSYKVQGDYLQEVYLVGLVDDVAGLGGTRGEPRGVGVGSVEGKHVEARQRVEIE